ncbi:MAG TPA: hypothetical protein VM848_04245 [Acidimicrobiia bacterium]|nr:hypothetical protein [Acidimicrobiia bacterium]
MKEARARARERSQLRLRLLEALVWRFVTSDSEGAQIVVQEFEDEHHLEPGTVVNSLWRSKNTRDTR